MKRPPVFLQNGGSCLTTIVLTISLSFMMSPLTKSVSQALGHVGLIAGLQASTE